MAEADGSAGVGVHVDIASLSLGPAAAVGPPRGVDQPRAKVAKSKNTTKKSKQHKPRPCKCGAMYVPGVDAECAQCHREFKFRVSHAVDPPVEEDVKWSMDCWEHMGAALEPPPGHGRSDLATLKARYSRRFNFRIQGYLEGVYACRNDMAYNDPANKCPRCWMVPKHCLCATLKPTPTGGNRIVVYMHWREASRRKASNTAKLVPVCMESGTIVACGDIPAETALYDLLETDPKAVVLYPCHAAVTPDALMRLRAAG